MTTSEAPRSAVVPLWLLLWLAIVGLASAVSSYRASQLLDWMDRPNWSLVAAHTAGCLAMVGLPTIVVRLAFMLAGGGSLSRWRAVSVAVLTTALWISSVGQVRHASVGQVQHGPEEFNGMYTVP